MAKKPANPPKRVTFTVSTSERPEFKSPLAAYHYDERGELVARADIRDGKFELSLPGGELGRHRVVIAPVSERAEHEKPTRLQLERMGAYEPVLEAAGALVSKIQVPGIIIDYWPFCFCYVRGRVIRYSDNRAVCNARVHICEVDRIPLIILRLPDLEVIRLRDDLLDILRNPRIPIPKPKPFPDPDPGPLFRLTRTDRLTRAGLNPQPLPPGGRVALNPQPFPPGPDSLQSLTRALTPELHARLSSVSTTVVRAALAEQWKLLMPWFCYWPWWW